ncbi:protein GL2-INTERACTING REPRESSOR 1-like [Zingiber officinale]|uniref:GIR1-like zinc ribbon domain-containing protein n=1 Tax=Zingiber officinale TaxID=94328 RepID=A0A8J5FW93_ZINOF|nr:protein GL2-INTERACTING REPRESSOR 1-like [Zingiber officinale]XP_042410407.1 protein GL2-INTERACTING REPRESSOR 1-like [Zingiber officinale]XP_042410408.1 protein GL2-INTERACTING REPRESSOR 1-like [Zingiber officinale]KAG6491622.1 hypothetical protein ZIOFF_046554 [Zingiber officinale]
MSRNNHGRNLMMELKLNVAATQRRARAGPSTRAEDEEEMPVSPPSSCVSEEEREEGENKSPEAAAPMMLVGCPRCLMYVMLSEKDPKCPKCKSTVLVDFHRGGGGGGSRRS